ncbi:hypothetical protein EK904_007165, partial [Melospiza melodia maxima]
PSVVTPWGCTRAPSGTRTSQLPASGYRGKRGMEPGAQLVCWSLKMYSSCRLTCTSCSSSPWWAPRAGTPAPRARSLRARTASTTAGTGSAGSPGGTAREG